MDGNGRWAAARGLPRLAGHRRGADAVRRTVEAAPDCGIGTLTLYAFSSDNWRRPAEEVAGIMGLFRLYLLREKRRCVDNGVRVSVIGRRDRLPAAIVDAIESIEEATRLCTTLHLRLAVDYSSRDSLLHAAKLCSERQEWTREAFTAALGPDVDLLIRTSGEQRLSDFLLWECAYAEFVFLDTHWPEFGERELRQALAQFASRDRRFGAAPQLRPAAANR
jgi:undecaprenyl diphosphate synthase